MNELKPAPAAPEVSPLLQSRLVALQQAGVVLDDYKLVVPRWDREVRNKIAPTLLDTRGRIIEAMQQGKHVLYVPGSYDLVHAGHASYILEGIETYLRDQKISRAQLYVVALADDDELIRAVKPPHLNFRNMDPSTTGGEHPRPIECDELFKFVTGPYPARLVDLASLPVDLVGALPAPSNFENMLSNPLFTGWLNRARHIVDANGAPPQAEAVRALTELIARIQEGRFVEVLQDFAKTKFNLFGPSECPRWDVGSWQYLLHLFLGDVLQPVENRPYVRMISHHDVKYKEVVAESMKLCGIRPHFVDDTTVVSTTDLLKQHGWQNLYYAKQRSFAKLDIH